VMTVWWLGYCFHTCAFHFYKLLRAALILLYITLHFTDLHLIHHRFRLYAWWKT
jgi:hypothetical protein